VWTDAVPKGSELRALVAEPFQVTPHSKITGMWLVSLPSGGTQSVFSSQIKDAPTLNPLFKPERFRLRPSWSEAFFLFHLFAYIVL